MKEMLWCLVWKTALSKIWEDKMCQVNNLKLKFDGRRQVYYVVSPDKRVLEEFKSDRDAVLFMQDCHDFLTPLGRKRKYGK